MIRLRPAVVAGCLVLVRPASADTTINFFGDLDYKLSHTPLSTDNTFQASTLDIFASRRDLAGLRLDHIVKAQDQPPVRREGGELGRVRRGRAKERQDVRHPGGNMLAEFRDAADGDARRCAAGAH